MYKVLHVYRMISWCTCCYVCRMTRSMTCVEQLTSSCQLWFSGPNTSLTLCHYLSMIKCFCCEQVIMPFWLSSHSLTAWQVTLCLVTSYFYVLIMLVTTQDTRYWRHIALIGAGWDVTVCSSCSRGWNVTCYLRCTVWLFFSYVCV